MHATGFGLSWLAIMLGLGGGLGLPLGVPPLPEDPMMAKIAPEESLAYISSAGMAVPDPKSVNQTEQLLAEPEVQSMVATLERAMRAGMGRSIGRGGLPLGVSPEAVADLVKLLLTRPLAVYVSSVEVQPGGPPSVRGGMAINLGEDVAKVQAKIKSLVKTAPPQAVKEIEIGGEKW